MPNQDLVQLQRSYYFSSNDRFDQEQYFMVRVRLGWVAQLNIETPDSDVEAGRHTSWEGAGAAVGQDEDTRELDDAGETEDRWSVLW